MNTIGPFRIDGNLGATAGIAEMLIQSHLKDQKGNFNIQLLPAIPSGWSSGSFNGLCARGGFELDMNLKEGNIEKVILSSKQGGSCIVCFGNKSIDLKLN